MARVTVEDCLDNVDNRFQLVLVASRRARQLANGRQAHVPTEHDKPTVVALREIAAGHVGRSILDEVVGQDHAGSSIISEAEAVAETTITIAEVGDEE